VQDAVFLRGEVITFALKAPPASPTAQIEWQSDRDGQLGKGAPLAVQNLSPVSHQVVVLANGVPQDTVQFTVQERSSWNLQLLGSAAPGGGDLWVEGDLVFVAGPMSIGSTQQGLHIFDIANPTAPQALAFYEADDVRPVSVAASGTVIYVAGRSSGSAGFVNTVGVRILDVTDPANPEVLADIESITEVFNVFVRDGFLYAANTESNTEGAIHVFDVSDPRDPKEVAEIRSPLGGRAFNLSVVGVRLYGVFLGENLVPTNLLVADVSNPAAPIVLGAVDVQGFFVSAWPTGDGRFVLTPSGNTVLVWDVANPMDMRIAATHRSFPGPSLVDVVMRGNEAYVTSASNGVEVIDLSDPLQPRMIAFYDPRLTFVSTDVGLTDAGLVVALFNREMHILAPQF
jgi:hypothetical protein